MKLVIDTDKKTISIENSVLMSELLSNLNRLFPNKEWREYTLETKSTIVWQNPIIIQPYQQPQTYPWISPLTYGTSTVTIGDTNGITYINNSDQTDLTIETATTAFSIPSTPGQTIYCVQL